MSLEDLPITEFESRASKFFKQPTDDMCYSCGITNALNDLGRKINNPSFKFSLNEINRLCGYKEGFACRDEIVPTVINSRLSRFGYNWTESMGAVNKIDQIKNQCEQEKLSLPLVNVSSEYFEYLGLRVKGARRLDHVLMIMGVDTSFIYYYDTYEGRINQRYVKRTMKITDFQKFWSDANNSRWMAWAYPGSLKQDTLTMIIYPEGEGT